MAIPQSCGTTAPERAPLSEHAHEAEKVEPSHKQDIAVTAKLEKPEPITVPKPVETPTAKELLPESVLGPPERDWATPGLTYDTVLLAREAGTPTHRGWLYRKNETGKIVGFEFSNRGGNRILPHRYDGEKNLFFTRDFQFRFDDRARQDIQLYISDWVPSRDKRFKLSGLVNSVIYFFPRTYLPAIIRSGKHFIVTLPTGEEVAFDAGTYEISGGVLSEDPVDLNPNLAARRFPAIRYVGKGVLVRANARGTDPRVGGVATITTGSPVESCDRGTACDQCKVPSKQLWNQKGAIRFKFSDDEDFDQYLQSRCGFGLPKHGPGFKIDSPYRVHGPSNR